MTDNDKRVGSGKGRNQLMKGHDMRTTLLATVAGLLIAGPAFAGPLVENNTDLRAQISNMEQQQKQLQAQIAAAKAQARANAGAAAGSSADISNPQTTGVTQEGDNYDGSLGIAYYDAPLPNSPIVSPSAVNFPQHTESLKVLGPLFGHSYTGGAGCTNSGAVATALLYRDAWLLTVQHYGVTAAAPAQAEYAKTLEAAGKACSE